MRPRFRRIWFPVSHIYTWDSKLLFNYYYFLDTDISRGFINNNLLALLEELRIRMHMDMSEELGIPRLDPFFVDALDLGPVFNELVPLNLYSAICF